MRLLGVCLGLWSVLGLRGWAEEVCYTFDASSEGWMSLDPEARVQQVMGTESVKAGAGALEFRYTLRAGALPVVGTFGLQPPQGFQGIDLWVRTSQDTTLALVVSEGDGSTYNFPFFVFAQRWTRVQARLEEFLLGDDQVDENQRLDAEQVGTLGLLDVAFFLAQLGQQPLPQPQRTLWLDEVRLTDQELPSRCPQRILPDGRAILWLGPSIEGPLFWVPVIGQVRMQAEKGQPVLHWRYRVTPQQPLSLLLFPGPPSLQGARGFRLRVRCPHTTVLGLALEERGTKGTYGAQIQVQGSPHWQEFTLPLEAFLPDPNKPDPDGKLDLAQVGVIFLADAAGGLQAFGEHELWIAEVAVEK